MKQIFYLIVFLGLTASFAFGQEDKEDKPWYEDVWDWAKENVTIGEKCGGYGDSNNPCSDNEKTGNSGSNDKGDHGSGGGDQSGNSQSGTQGAPNQNEEDEQKQQLIKKVEGATKVVEEKRGEKIEEKQKKEQANKVFQKEKEDKSYLTSQVKQLTAEVDTLSGESKKADTDKQHSEDTQKELHGKITQQRADMTVSFDEKRATEDKEKKLQAVTEQGTKNVIQKEKVIEDETKRKEKLPAVIEEGKAQVLKQEKKVEELKGNKKQVGGDVATVKEERTIIVKEKNELETTHTQLGSNKKGFVENNKTLQGQFNASNARQKQEEKVISANTDLSTHSSFGNISLTNTTESSRFDFTFADESAKQVLAESAQRIDTLVKENFTTNGKGVSLAAVKADLREMQSKIKEERENIVESTGGEVLKHRSGYLNPDFKLDDGEQQAIARIQGYRDQGAYVLPQLFDSVEKINQGRKEIQLKKEIDEKVNSEMSTLVQQKIADKQKQNFIHAADLSNIGTRENARENYQIFEEAKNKLTEGKVVEGLILATIGENQTELLNKEARKDLEEGIERSLDTALMSGGIVVKGLLATTEKVVVIIKNNEVFIKTFGKEGIEKLIQVVGKKADGALKIAGDKTLSEGAKETAITKVFHPDPPPPPETGLKAWATNKLEGAKEYGKKKLDDWGVTKKEKTFTEEQQKLLDGEPGVNVASKKDALQHREIISGGKMKESLGTPVTNLKTVERVIGKLPTSSDRMVISKEQARELARTLGVNEDRFEKGAIISVIEDVASRFPRSPLKGSEEYFVGPGQGLPKGSVELNIAPIKTVGGKGIRQIIVEVK